MTWRVVAASAAGTSHVAHDAACEDRCLALIDPPGLLLAVADGAGSAARAAEGAELALNGLAAFWRALDGIDHLDAALAAELIRAARAGILDRAAVDGLSPRHFACTLLAVIATPTASLALQIGDGAIAVDAGAGLELALTPMTGEYANMTCFVTDDDALERLQVRVFDTPLVRAAVLTDGLQRLALDLSLGVPHAPFFAPLFDTLAGAAEDSLPDLSAALTRFLDSRAVNARTDDDKSLALAVRMG